MKCEAILENEIATRYLRGELSEPDRDTYETHYFECERCFAELEALRLAQGELVRQASSIRAEAIGTPRRAWNWMWIAGPALAGAAFVGLLLMRPPAALVVEQAKQPPPMAQPSTGTPNPLLALANYEAPTYQQSYLRGTNTTPEFQQAMAAYQARNWAEALAQLKVAGEDPRTLFFRAACELLTGDAANAKSHATRVIAAGETPYLEESYYLRAKAHLLSLDEKAAAGDLEKLASLHGDWEMRARQLLVQLRAVR